MIVVVEDGLTLRLKDPCNFRQFHVEMTVPRERLDQVRAAIGGDIEFDDAATAWVALDGIQAMPGAPGDAEWISGLSVMIGKARPHGWVRDLPRLAIRAHVAWPSAASAGD